MQNYADCMGCERNKSIHSSLDDRLACAINCYPGLYFAIQMVAARCIRYCRNFIAAGIDTFKIKKKFFRKRFSSIKFDDKTGYVYRHCIYDLFLFLAMNKIILASQSPRRKQLLEWAEVPFEIIVQDTDERFPPDIEPDEVAVYIARNKALAVQQIRKSNEVIVAADTIVVLGDNIIGKPVHREDAVSILLALSGEKHKVITGVVIRQGDKEISFADITEVEFHNITVKEIEFYVDKYKPYDKAGAYAIQEWIGVVGIKSINGDFYNVMGLPVSRVVRELKKFDV